MLTFQKNRTQFLDQFRKSVLGCEVKRLNNF